MYGNMICVDWQDVIKSLEFECEGCGKNLYYKDNAYQISGFTGFFCEKCKDVLSHGGSLMYQWQKWVFRPVKEETVS